ncbi:glycosyltransferase [Nocardia wallacei]|uniref:glycosyltransferase n=1 Tax=Nocardia wallacei TaxID=480035 RepID=UPI002455846F|nr:glycosyltransferase [Nocardia wallacei]
MIEPLPAGLPIVIDPDVRMISDTLWWGGAPNQIICLTSTGHRLWQRIQAGGISGEAEGDLARLLTDAGFAHPCPPPRTGPEATVIVVLRSAPSRLRRSLAALASAYPVRVVIDDESEAPAEVTAVADRLGITVLRHEGRLDLMAARRCALHRVKSDLVAYLDSGCLPSPGWIERLAGHFDDPLVAAVAPRITAPGTRANGLDLGDRPARVTPDSTIGFVSSTALLARRDAFADIGGEMPGFDMASRMTGWDDLAWQFHAAGWRVRYDPGVHVRYEPGNAGTGAGPLAAA